ncbi:hypothetical protein RB200_10730 [Streptomyces sp. PmtG]
MTPAARAIVLAAVEDAQREHVDHPSAVVARIEAELRDQGWTITQREQAEPEAA